MSSPFDSFLLVSLVWFSVCTISQGFINFPFWLARDIPGVLKTFGSYHRCHVSLILRAFSIPLLELNSYPRVRFGVSRTYFRCGFLLIFFSRLGVVWRDLKPQVRNTVIPTMLGFGDGWVGGCLSGDGEAKYPSARTFQTCHSTSATAQSSIPLWRQAHRFVQGRRRARSKGSNPGHNGKQCSYYPFLTSFVESCLISCRWPDGTILLRPIN